MTRRRPRLPALSRFSISRKWSSRRRARPVRPARTMTEKCLGHRTAPFARGTVQMEQGFWRLSLPDAAAIASAQAARRIRNKSSPPPQMPLTPDAPKGCIVARLGKWGLRSAYRGPADARNSARTRLLGGPAFSWKDRRYRSTSALNAKPTSDTGWSEAAPATCRTAYFLRRLGPALPPREPSPMALASCRRFSA